MPLDFRSNSMYININRFEWDRAKAHRNLAKHGVSFSEAATVFHDSAALIAEDSAHSEAERRLVALGASAWGLILVVVFTMRPGSSVRIISARPASREEKILYAQSE